MALLTLNKKELEAKIGKITPEIEEKISMFGTPVEKLDENEISIEIFPNRPDLLSLQGFSRAILAFLEKKPGLRSYKTEKPEKDYKVTIDKSVKKVRPFTACAIVKNLKLNDERIKELIDIQEKLHLTYGRDRKKIAIGIYPLEKIKLPITFLAKKPEEIKFIPLEQKREMNGRQILAQHPTGKAYAYLLEGQEVFPIFKDANNEILSMPPIINSERTGKITESTTEVFIECSGHNLEYLKKALNIIVCAMAEMGAKIYEIEIQDSKKYNSPDLQEEVMKFSIENINKNLGLNLSEKEIKRYFEKMGMQVRKDEVLIPAYRTDILNEIDLVEEIAIAYGYENFKEEIPKISTIAEEDKISILKKKISEILIGLELLEVSTFHLSTKEIEFKNIGIRELKDMDLIEVIDSKTENNILRTNLISHEINILSKNSDVEYPHKIFELGKVFSSDDESETGISEKEKLCICISSEKSNFTEIKQILDYIMRMLDIKFRLEDTEHPAFIEGRIGKIILENNSKEIGIIGEVSPIVLRNNKIKMPTVILEMDIEQLINQPK
jgi:phenylalanyl-tRNA synthetase beta chain